jgi:hypothetical protein
LVGPGGWLVLARLAASATVALGGFDVSSATAALAALDALPGTLATVVSTVFVAADTEAPRTGPSATAGWFTRKKVIAKATGAASLR